MKAGFLEKLIERLGRIGPEDRQARAALVLCGLAVGGHGHALRLCDSAVAAGRSRGGLP